MHNLLIQEIINAAIAIQDNRTNFDSEQHEKTQSRGVELPNALTRKQTRIPKLPFVLSFRQITS